MSEHHHHNHDHDHDHDHDHGHHSHGHHHHQPKNFNRAFTIGVGLNFIFVIIEALYGYFSHSLALVADAGHNLSDVAGLLLAWGAFWLTQKNPSTRFTFGLRKSSILAALLNALVLMLAVGIILWESIHRLMNPGQVDPKIVMIVAAIGILINGMTAMLFFKDKDEDINLRGAYLHMAADALISLGVVISGFIISLTGLQWIDPFMSIIISLVIIYGTWDLLIHSLHLSMDAVPANINPAEVKHYLESIEDVVDVHDLHIWAMGTTETALTAHLTMKKISMTNEKLSQITGELKHRFKIHHPTLQVELKEDHYLCQFQPDNVL